MSITLRQLFENLTLARGRALADLFEIEGLVGLNKNAFVDAISRKRSLKPEAVLNELNRDELKSLCDNLGLGTSGREKQLLIDRLLNNDSVREQAPPYTVKQKTAARAKQKTNSEALPLIEWAG